MAKGKSGARVEARVRMPTSPKGVQGMSKWESVFRCEKLGVDDCVVWWDAVSVVVAVAGVGVTILSALAVFWLGRRANALALAGQRYVSGQEVAARARLDEERIREEQVVLCYLKSDFSTLAVWMAVAQADLANGSRLDENVFTTDGIKRQVFVNSGKALDLTRLEKVLPRLHLLPEATGLRLARIVAGCQIIHQTCLSLDNEKSPSDYSTVPSAQKTQEDWLRVMHQRIKGEVEVCRDMVDYCNNEASKVLRRKF